MCFSNDLNLLAANNIIGYDTYANTLNGMGMNYRQNNFAVKGLKPNNQKDTFTSSKTNIANGGLLAACGLAISCFLLKGLSKSKNFVNIKECLQKGMKNSSKRTSTAAKSAKKAATKGSKSVLSKIGKTCKTATMIVGIGTIATGALKLYNAIKTKKEEISELTNQPQEYDQTMYVQNKNTTKLSTKTS